IQHLILFITFITIISTIIFNLNKFLLIIGKINLEKEISFECGFNPISKFILPFSIPFLSIRLLFLMFDTEIALSIPIIFHLKYFYHIINIIVLFIFIYIYLH
ncbi:hypothetical protein E2986_13446, partial [Frieseomelitta varia]